jgi:molybdopterin-biosynthesis enzyme MoeA-like protein
MMAWVLDTHYRSLFDPGGIAERSIIVRGAGESQLIDVMNQCLERYPRLKVFSLPRMEPERHVELGVRGDAAQVPAAISVLQQGVSTLGFQWNDAPSQGAA